MNCEQIKIVECNAFEQAPVDAKGHLLDVVHADMPAIALHNHESSEEPSEARDPFLGTTLDGKYEIISLLGGGGAGHVYKARNIFINKILAIKVLSPHQAMDESKVQRLKQEALAISCLDHPNIVNVIDFGLAEKGQPYLVMEYVDGIDLSDLIKREGALPLERALPLLIQACDALAHANIKGLVHRDLKPSNMMLVQADNGKELVKIIDFGLVKQLTDGEEGILHLTQTGEVFGSPYYMSPEQIRAQKVDVRTDIYSMGIVIFEVLMGRPPFFSNDPAEVFNAQLSESPGRLTNVKAPPHLRDWLELVVLKATAKNPDRRYQTMDELRSALLSLSNAPKGLAHSGTLLGLFIARLTNHAGDSVKRAWIIAMSLMILLAIASGIAVGVFWRSANDNRLPPQDAYKSRPSTQQMVIEDYPPADFGEVAARVRLYLKQRQYDKAELLIKPYSDINNRLTNSQELIAAQVLYDVGVAYLDANMCNKAIPWFERAQIVLNKSNHGESPERFAVSHALSHCLKMEKRYGEAVQVAKEALSLRLKQGEKGPEISESVLDLAGVYLNMGKTAEAEALARKALGLERKWPHPYPEFKARLEYFTGVTLDGQAKYSEAEPFYRAALQLRNKSADDRAILGLTLESLANNSAKQGRPDEAKELLEQATALASGTSSQYP